MIKHIQKITALLFFSVLCLFNNKVDASHSMGSDLTYECVGPNQYKVRLSFYRDCIGIAAPTSVVIPVTSASCGINLSVTCNPIPGTGQEITPICPSATSTCNGGVFTGIQEWVYEGVITLPAQCTDWVFSYRLCCRNAAITTITNPTAQYIYLYATLNNTISPCNNSPAFSNKPVPFVCQGQQFCFNHGAYDVDGDSLVYELIDPLHDAGVPVSYIAPYSATQPLNSVPAMQFDSNTGDFCITPQSLQVTVMAVLVKEYRNGVLIGTVERDIQITVIACTNNLPTLSGINCTNVFDATICANESFCFNVCSDDADAGQNVFLSYDGTVNGATFTTAGSPHPTGTFCWTPSNADIGTDPHCFTIRVFDDACPYIGSQIYSYCLTVKGLNVSAGPDQFITCSDLATVTATVSGGTGGPYTYLWSNGFTNPTQTVGVGTYVVTVSDGQCSATDTVQILPISIPVAAFTATGACVNSPIQFTNQSTAPGSTIISWQWNFGNGQSSSQQNPVVTFTTAGTYNVCLMIETDLGCRDTVCQNIIINPIPVASFTVGNVCAGYPVNINNTSTPPGGISGWNWNFGNGQTSNNQNPTVAYVDSGTYTITLIAGDTLGCADTATQQVTIYPSPIAAFTFAGNTACTGGPVSFSNTSTGNIISWNWNFGNGQTSNQQNPNITFSNSGSYNVTLVVTSANGCIDSISQAINIAPPPTANAGLPQSICVGQSVTLQASGGVTYQWSNGQTTSNISVNPSTTTTYTVTVTDASGCPDTAQVTVSIIPPPVINVPSAQTICNGQSVTLNATGGISYQWSPTGDTTSSITVSPTSSTTYQVTGTNAAGCQATAFASVTVRNNPVLNIPNTFVCAGVTATLNAGGNNNSTYQWSNGSTTQSITVTNPGTYSVTVTNQWGCTASTSVQVAQGGTISNNLNNVAFCSGGSAVLDAGNPGNTYVWAPGGQTSQTITVSNAGQYAVTITNSNGCSATVTTTVNVDPIPNVDFTPNDVCIGEPINFQDISTVATGNITGWFWDLGDGNVSQLQDPIHNYSSAGTFNVTLQITTAAGCSASVSKTVTVYPLPVPDFTFTGICQGQNVNFTNASTVWAGNINSWQWNFGDGGTSSQQNPSHQFTTPGTYNVSLVVATAGGCADSITKQVTIFSLPVAAFNGTNVCKGAASDFTDLSSVIGNNINAWSWDFGDGSISSQQNPSHTYANAGTYNISLNVTSANGCTDNVTGTVTVHALPVANAGNNQSVCRGITANLTATGGVNYLWSPTGDTTATISVSPVTTTWYNVEVTDGNGCKARDSARVQILSIPNVVMSPDTGICIGQNVNLTATGGTGYLWSTGANSNSITVAPTTNSYYTVIVSAANGCTATDSVNVTVHALPIANAGNDQSLCEGQTITLTASGGINYQWAPTGDTSRTIYVTPAVATNYYVTVIDANGCANIDSVGVTVNAAPLVNLGNPFICAGSFTVLDAGNAGSTYQWSPNGDTTQTIQVSTAGTFGVLVTNAAGCVTYAQSTVAVGGDSIINNAGNVNVCAGLIATLNAGNPGATYLWSTGATTQNISVSTAGTYTVTITDPNGCSATFASTLVNNPLPVVDFTATTVCLNDVTQFNNLSSVSAGSIVSYNWNFGNGIYSNANSPTQTYTQPGNYTATLVATTGFGCVDSINKPVVINATPLANFGNNAACYGQATSFNDLSTISSGSISSWQWNFGDGDSATTQNPQHVYDVPGTYTTTLTVSSGNGCTDSISQSVTINPAPIAAFTFNNVCEGSSIDFINTSYINGGIIDAYDWNFGDGNTSNTKNPSHTYATAGTYNVTLNVRSDMMCDSSITIPVRVYPNPVAAFTAPSVCENTPIIFNDNSTINSTDTIQNWYWSFGDNSSDTLQNASHQYAAAGTYNVMQVVTSSNGCRDTISGTVTVNSLPVPNFASGNICEGSSLQFSDSSSVANSNISNWNWNFGNGQTSTSQNPSMSFTSAGSFPVTLAVTSAQGCVDSTTLTINVYPLPVADFTAGDICLGGGIAFFNQSSVNGGGTFNLNWSFGDGDSSSSENPVHTYLNSGTYTVNLTVTTNSGCTDVTSQQVTVNAPPVARFNANNSCEKELTTFNDLSTTPQGIIVSWNWNFGDGTTSTSKSPVHQYNSYGSYPVELEVTSSLGCTNRYRDTIDVYRAPEPQISLNGGCLNVPVTIADISDTISTGTVSWLWDFGDGATDSTSSATTHQYATAGTYTVTLTAVNANGCRTTTSQVVAMDPIPNADFAGGPGCEDVPTQFTNTSTVTQGTIASYQWLFGDSTVSTSQNPSHTFTEPGTYNVTLIVGSSLGCYDTIVQQVVIYPSPVSNFTFNQAAGCGPLLINFYDSSYVSIGNVIAWNWDFGDGSANDSTQNPSHTYYASGSYPVILTVTSSNGCVHTNTINNAITIYPSPQAAFEPDPYETTILQPLISFDNQTTGGNLYYWNFGDGGHSSLMNPSHAYGDTGTYTVNLYTVNSFGCEDTAIRTVVILPVWTVYIPNAFTPNNDGTNEVFTIKGLGIIDYNLRIWDRWGELIFEGDNRAWDGSVKQTEVYAKKDVYVYQVVLKDVFGVTHERKGTVTLIR